MKYIVLSLFLLTTQSVFARGSHSVRGYTKRSGTHVTPHHATNRNNTKSDNWSTKGNVNPYTGKSGTKNP